jgi:hypothetical protein
VNEKTGAALVTLTSTQTGNTAFGFTLLACTGIASTAPVDDFGGQANAPGGSNVVSSPALTLTGPQDLVVAVFTDTAGGGSMNPGAGLSVRGSNPSLYSMVEDNLPGSFVATASLPGGATDNCWSVAVAAFHAR